MLNGVMYRKASLRAKELYGITGSKGHGKDTFARLIVEANERNTAARNKGISTKSFTIAHFAADLKHMSGRIFGLSLEQMHDPALKEATLKAPLDMDLFLEAMCSETGLSIQPAGKIARSPREVMQYFGTEYVRRTQDDYWIQRLIVGVQRHRRALVPDTRFLNETAAIRLAGGRVIKIVRIDAPEKTDGHSSETEMAAIEPDLLIGVRTDDLSLPKRIANLVAAGKFAAACKYDYRKARKAIESYVSGKSVEESARLLGQDHKDPYTLHNILDYYGIQQRKRAPNRRAHKIVEGIELKWCSDCKDWRSIGEFNDSSKAWDGLARVCRPCASKSNKNRYEKYSKADSLAAIFALYRRAASFRGLTFDLKLDDLKSMWEKQAGRCYYSGRALTTTVRDPNKVSIDRLDSSKGYSRKNSVLCTKRVNFMKREMSVELFREIVRGLYHHMFAEEDSG